MRALVKQVKRLAKLLKEQTVRHKLNILGRPSAQWSMVEVASHYGVLLPQQALGNWFGLRAQCREPNTRRRSVWKRLAWEKSKTLTAKTTLNQEPECARMAQSVPKFLIWLRLGKTWKLLFTCCHYPILLRSSGKKYCATQTCTLMMLPLLTQEGKYLCNH